jgi:hypothetical protein
LFTSASVESLPWRVTSRKGKVIAAQRGGKEMSREESLVTGYVKLWPREVSYMEDSQCVGELRKSLERPGVYILYQDFDVFYVGQSDCLFKRLSEHATKRYRLWNHFSDSWFRTRNISTTWKQS